MKKIHIFIHTLNHSGLVHAAVMMANGIAEKGYDAKLVVIGQPAQSPYEIDDKIEVDFLNIKRGVGLFGKIRYMLQAIGRIKRYIKQENAENLLIWGKEFTSLIVFLRCFFGLKAKIIGVNVISISAHLNYNKGKLAGIILKRIYKIMLSHADHIIAQSEGMVDELKDDFGVKAQNLNVAYPALSPKFFGLEVESDKENEILFVGRLAHQKNPEAALRAFAKIYDKNVSLRFLGDGELMDDLKQLAKELNIEGRVIFEGAKDNVIPYMQKAKLLLMTSRYEGFGMVLAEAIACGTPVVAVNCPVGPSEIIIRGENGYLAEDEEEIVFRVNEALDKTWDYKKLPRTVEKFSPKNVLPGYMEAINKVYNNE